MRSPTRPNCANSASAAARLLVQVLLARLGDVIELAGAIGLDGGVADLLEVGERGVHHAGARDVEALGALVQRLDDFVAVAWFFGEQSQYQQLQVDGGQFSAHAEAAAAHAAAFHEAPAEVAEAVTAVMPAKEVM